MDGEPSIESHVFLIGYCVVCVIATVQQFLGLSAYAFFPLINIVVALVFSACAARHMPRVVTFAVLGLPFDERLVHQTTVPWLVRVVQTICFCSVGGFLGLLLSPGAIDSAPYKDMASGILGVVVGWIIGRTVWEALSAEDDVE